MSCYPTTSGKSHLLEEVFLGAFHATEIPTIHLLASSAYGTGTQGGCSTSAHSTCSGSFETTLESALIVLVRCSA